MGGRIVVQGYGRGERSYEWAQPEWVPMVHGEKQGGMSVTRDRMYKVMADLNKSIVTVSNKLNSMYEESRTR